MFEYPAILIIPLQDECGINSNTKLGAKEHKKRSRKIIGKQISNMQVRRHKLRLNGTKGNKLTDITAIKSDVFWPFMRNMIERE
jgi:hypothetical protein